MASLPVSFRQGSRSLWNSYRVISSILLPSTSASCTSSSTAEVLVTTNNFYGQKSSSSSFLFSSSMILPSILYQYLPSFVSSRRTFSDTISRSLFSIPFINPLPHSSTTPPSSLRKSDGSSVRFVSSILTDIHNLLDSAILTMNRNAREPRKANNGARPCSNVRRKRKLLRRANPHPYIPGKKKKGYDI